MGVKSFIKKSVAFVSAVAMACSMVVMPAGVSYAEGTTTDSGLNLNKTVELQEDGTYKIRLESYAEGTVTKTPDRVNPCDIVLVLDQSGSMAYGLGSAIKCSNTTDEQKALGATVGYYCYKQRYDGTNYYYKVRYYNNKWQYFDNYSDWNGDGNWIDLSSNSSIYVSRIGALKQSVTNFVNSIKDNAVSKNVDHKIAIVGYANDSEGGLSYSGFISPGSTSGEYMNTGVFLNGTLNKYSNSPNYTNALVSVKDGTSVANSITTAIGNIACNGGTYTKFGLEMANNILAANKNDRHDKVVVVFTDGETDSSISNVMTQANIAKGTNNAKVYTVGMFESTDDSITDFLSHMSSNYGSNVEYESYWGVYNYYTGTYNNTEKYSMTASNKEELNNIFTTIAGDIQNNVTVELDENAVTKDIITDNLDIPTNLASKVNAYTESYLGNGNWQTDTLTDDDKPVVSVSGKTVDVTNFNYKENFVAEASASAGTAARGKRLVIEISGLTAVKSGENMITNVTDQSGVYENNQATTPIDTFNECSITIPDKSYVLDYGKTVVSNTIKDDCGISKVDFCNTVKPSPYETSNDGTYGTFDLANVSNGGTISYTPGKINWDGFDSAYVFGAVGNGYLWSAVNFIPASSVYYEDDFGTETQSDPNVSIVWSDGWNTEKDKESSKDNSQSSVNQQYGWDESYVDDTQSSNGSSHWSTTSKATATFRFTGTAVDIYSRTNKDVGRIIGRIKKVNDDGTTTGIKTMTIDNLSESSGDGSYYQIPTLFFDGLEYGTYEVTITVNPIKDSEGNVVRAKYYLDGVRVYHPLNPDALDPIASDAYDEANESNAKYITLRNDLIDATTSTEITSKIQGAVFIDKSGNTNDIGTYRDYGPKNEVYLAKNNGVAFTVDGYNADTDKVFVGLKSITGKETNVSITGETSAKSISSAADLYYEVKPDSNGNVVITNNTENILSVTKVRITTKSGVQNTRMLVATPQLMSYAANFELSEDTTQTDTDLDEDDVDIDNPSDNDSTQEDTTQTEEQPSTSIWQQILNSLNKWFRR